MKYVQVGRLEFFIPQRPYNFGRVKAHCGCLIFEFGPIGFTILSKECAKDE